MMPASLGEDALLSQDVAIQHRRAGQSSGRAGGSPQDLVDTVFEHKAGLIHPHCLAFLCIGHMTLGVTGSLSEKRRAVAPTESKSVDAPLAR